MKNQRHIFRLPNRRTELIQGCQLEREFIEISSFPNMFVLFEEG